jgi:hypothetical protein
MEVAVMRKDKPMMVRNTFQSHEVMTNFQFSLSYGVLWLDMHKVISCVFLKYSAM